MSHAARPLILLGLLLWSTGIISVQAEEACPKATAAPIALSKARQTFASGHEVLIVALGSSSTEGWMASNIAHSYPALLQENLSLAFPQAHFAVVNKGVGGQDAQEELARLDDDVIELKPDLVIWQVGANGAMENADPSKFRERVTSGIQRMRAAGSDVVLMDNQRSPMILASPEHVVLEQALADLGAQLQVPVFSRGALMDAWRQEGADYGLFLANDNVHMNDYGYRCLAAALSKALEPGFNAGLPSRVAIASHAVN